MKTLTGGARAGGTHRPRVRVWVPVAQSALAVVTLFAFAASAAPGATAVMRPAPKAHPATLTGFAGPARETPTRRPGATGPIPHFTSRNWGGYITYVTSEGTDFESVQATWVQPTVTCPKPRAWSVFWVGFDGWWNDTVEQGGTSAECVGGVPEYESWWEMYPTNAITTVFAISPGDKITASVTYETSTSTFVIAVSDLTSDQSFTMDEQCAADLTCDRSSADVIAEDVGKSGSGSYFPLADYKTMKFTNSEVADVNSDSGPLADPNWLNASVEEESGATTYAKISALNGKGNGFAATWEHD
jgi:Peptidase A4 family